MGSPPGTLQRGAQSWDSEGCGRVAEWQALNETQGSHSSMSLPEFYPNPNQNAFNDFLMNQSVTQTAIFKSKHSISAHSTVPPAVFSLPKLANAAAEQLKDSTQQHPAEGPEPWPFSAYFFFSSISPLPSGELSKVTVSQTVQPEIKFRSAGSQIGT